MSGLAVCSNISDRSISQKFTLCNLEDITFNFDIKFNTFNFSKEPFGNTFVLFMYIIRYVLIVWAEPGSIIRWKKWLNR